jgi:predicted RNase H-like nuclease (RuvC/YqgF family)
MKFQDLDLAKDYEGLRIQFNALKRIAISQQEQLQHYQKRVQEFSVERVIQLEAELESQKEMNAILTQELEQIGYSIEHLRKAIELARKGDYEQDWSGGIQVVDKYDENEIIAMIIKEKHQIQ